MNVSELCRSFGTKCVESYPQYLIKNQTFITLWQLNHLFFTYI